MASGYRKGPQFKTHKELIPAINHTNELAGGFFPSWAAWPPALLQPVRDPEAGDVAKVHLVP